MPNGKQFGTLSEKELERLRKEREHFHQRAEEADRTDLPPIFSHEVLSLS